MAEIPYLPPLQELRGFDALAPAHNIQYHERLYLDEQRLTVLVLTNSAFWMYRGAPHRVDFDSSLKQKSKQTHTFIRQKPRGSEAEGSAAIEERGRILYQRKRGEQRGRAEQKNRVP